MSRHTVRDYLFLFLVSCFLWLSCHSQEIYIKGRITSDSEAVPFANITIRNTSIGNSTDSNGYYQLRITTYGTYEVIASALGYQTAKRIITISDDKEYLLDIVLKQAIETLDDIVVSGTLKPVRRLSSPVPVEVYSPAFLNKNPSANIFEGLSNVNGVRPQINCNVCNTGDVHINGLEGPYTLVLIDGMPIVSGLGTVYGLSGIPNSLISQIEIVKGPASSLYGSEAVGGLINIITKHPPEAPELEVDSYVTGWGEYNLDLGSKLTFRA